MAGNDLENMTPKELSEHFQQLVSTHAQDIESRVAGAMDRIDGLEGTFATKFQDVTTNLAELSTKFDRLLAQLQPPRIPAPVLPAHTVQRARRVLPDQVEASGASAAPPPAARENDDDGYEADGISSTTNLLAVHAPTFATMRHVLRFAMMIMWLSLN